MARSERFEDMAIDLSVIVSSLWRARIWLVPLVILVAIGSFAGLSLMAPKFKADSKILIEVRSLSTATSQREADADRTLVDQEGVASQVQLITSRDVGRRVLAKENLADSPEFAARPGLLRRLIPFLGRPGAQTSPDERLLEAYFERLSVYQIERSRVITIEFTAGNPELAARIANAVAREYLIVQAESKVSNTSETTRWLDGEIVSLRAKVAEAEGKVERWRVQNDLFGTTKDGTLVDQQLGGMNAQLTTARTDKTNAEARARQLREVLDSGAALDTSSEVSNSPTYQRLREREVALRNRVAELSATLLPGHPQMKTLQSQIADIQAQERAEARRILAAYDNDVKIADQRIKDLRSAVGDSKSLAAKANENDIQLRALEREAKAQRDLLETFLARYREAASRQSETAQPPDARQISAASPPSQAYFPKVAPLTAVITLAVFLLACTGLVLRDLVSGRALRPADAAAADRVAMNEPSNSNRRDEAGNNGDEPSPPDGGSGPGGGVRGLLGRLETPGAGVVAIASTGPDDRGHAAARLIAATMANQGKVCLVVAAGLPETAPGLADLFDGSTSFADVIDAAPVLGCHMIGLGTRVLEDAAFATPGFGIILDALAASYDAVVLDCGVVPVDRPHLVARMAMADEILLVPSPTILPGADEIVAFLGENGARLIDLEAPSPVADEMPQPHVTAA